MSAVANQRWYVFGDDRPVDWAEAVKDGVAVQEVHVVICDSAVSEPWRVLWIPRGMAVPLAQLHYAQESQSDEPMPALRRRMPGPAATKPLPRAQLRMIRGGLAG